MTRRRNRSQYDVRTYLGRDLYERVLRSAAARHLSASECVRLDLKRFYALSDELAAAVQVDDGDDRPPGQRIMHNLLDQMEVRIAAGIGAQATAVARLHGLLRRVECMIDRQYLGVMLHLPEVGEELWDERSSSATGRHRAWRREIEALLADAEDGEAVGRETLHDGTKRVHKPEPERS